MKKIMMILVVLVQTTLFAQSKQTTIEKPLKLTSVVKGTRNDSILLYSSTKYVKFIPASELKTITNLDYLATPIGGTIFSSTGIDAVISLATESNAGLFSPAEKTKLSGVQQALDSKVDKVTGKSLLSDTEIARLATLSNYTHPANHPPSIISQDASNRFVTDTEKATWNAKQSTSQKNTANGYAGLGADGKLISSQLPSITISDTFVTASQAAMLAVMAETGDVAVRTDLNKSFILKGTNPAVLADWQELLSPTSAVTTVFGRNGAVTAQAGDYNTDQIAETANRKFQTANQNTFNDATSSIQTQLNGKQTNLGFVPANDANVVHKTGIETILDSKIFNAALLLPINAPAYSVTYPVISGVSGNPTLASASTAGGAIAFNTTALTTTKTLTFRDLSGTAALTSDLSAYSTVSGSNINQSSFRTALGLGSNAYTSTAYLSLSGANMSGNIGRSSHSSGCLVGSYNSVGDNASKTNPIYVIGSAYTPSDTALNNMYGIGFSASQFWGAGKSDSWGLYFAEAGVMKSILGASIWTSGNVTAGGDVIAFSSSDKRLKDNIKPIENPLEKINKIGGYTFDWNNKQDAYKGHDVGVIAQEIEVVLPELVTTRDNGFKAVKYDKLVALLIEGMKAQQKQINELKKQVKKLKR
jgi:hypothetical protein